MAASYKIRALFLVVLCAASSMSLAQQAGENVRLRGQIVEDVYVAGGTVDIMASVEGDVVAAGGRVTVRDRVTGDVMAAGGAVTVYADVGDDVRLAGGDVTLSGNVGGDALVAAGHVTITPDSEIGGRLWLSGGDIDVAGAIGKELRAAGGRIMLSGRVDGNVELVSDHIIILDDTTITGNLSYRSPQKAAIEDGAQILGSIDYEPVEQPVVAVGAAVAATGIVALLSFAVTGIALFLLFPRTINASVATIRSEFWKCLGLGLAIFAATPVVIFLLFMTVVGWLPAVVIGPIYLILLLAGFLTAVFYVGDLGLGLFRRGEPSRARRLWSFALALVVVTVIGLVPVVGALSVFVLMLLGVGVLNLYSYRSYTARPGV